MFRLEITGYDELMKQLDKIEEILSGRVKREMVKAAGEIVAARARELCPVGDDQERAARLAYRQSVAKKKRRRKKNIPTELKALRDTIAVEIRDYGKRQLALVGPQYPAGAHGHLIEYGHEVIVHGKHVGKTEPNSFIRRAFDETKDAQLAAMERVLAQAIRDLGG